MWKRMKPGDRALLVVLGGLYLIAFSLFFYEQTRGHLHPQWLQVHAAASPDDYPVVTEEVMQMGRLAAGLEPGDALVELSGVSLRGAGAWHTLVTAATAPDADGLVPTTLIRDGERLEVTVEPITMWGWFGWLLPLSFGVAGILAFIGSGGAGHARSFFFACLAFGSHLMLFDSPSYVVSALGLATFITGGVLVGPLALLALQRIPAEHEPLSTWSRTWPWIFLVSGVAYPSAIIGFPFDAKFGIPVSMLGNVAVAALGISIIVRNYRRAGPAGRRQVRWIALGVCVGLLPTIFMSILVLIEPNAFGAFVVANLSFMAIPICFIIAIVGYGAFDFDRIVATALGFAAAVAVGVAIALGIAGPASHTVAGLLDVSDDAAHAGLLVALAFGVLPVTRALQPRFFAYFFPARTRARDERDRVLADLARCESEDELAIALRTGLSSLLGPSWQLAVVRDIDGELTTLFDTRPPGVTHLDATDLAALFAATAPTRIEQRGTLARSDGWLDDAARERLESAGASVALPIHVPDQPTWLVVLGVKTNDDVVPPSEMALLAEIAGRTALALMRIRAADLAVQNRAERQIHVERSKFLAATSHDLRQPLHSFGLHLGALSGEDLSPKARHLVGQLDRSLDELQQQFESVLQVSKLDAGVVEPNVGRLALGPMLDSLAASLTPVAASRGLELGTTPTALWVESDPLLLGRIVRNLAENALRYTTEGGVRIEVGRLDGRVRIEVHDTGPGIAPEELDSIFAEFSRGRSRGSTSEGAENEVPEGLGLGLSIVDRLARLLAHPIGLDSTPGEGSVFWIEVPLADAPDEAVAAPSAAPIVPSELAGASIWVVDDEASVLDGLEALLQSWGCEVVTAKGGAEALAKLETTTAPPDVVVMDDQLGSESGTDVVDAFTDELEARAAGALPEFVFVTGNTDPKRLAELAETGHAVLSKPVPVMRLRAALAHAVSQPAASS